MAEVRVTERMRAAVVMGIIVVMMVAGIAPLKQPELMLRTRKDSRGRSLSHRSRRFAYRSTSSVWFPRWENMLGRSQGSCVRILV